MIVKDFFYISKYNYIISLLIFANIETITHFYLKNNLVMKMKQNINFNKQINKKKQYECLIKHFTARKKQYKTKCLRF